MKRMGLCNRLRSEKAEEYKRLHAAAWPGVLATISACNIRNVSIFFREPIPRQRSLSGQLEHTEWSAPLRVDNIKLPL